MVRGYRLKAPISAILDKPSGEHVSVIIPAGVVLHDSSQPSTTLLGMVGVLWEGRHYSVSFKDLLKNARPVQDSCDECLRLENRLRRANDYYARLILQQDRMIQDGDPEASALHNEVKKARRERTAAAQDLLAHGRTHDYGSLPKTKTAGQL